MARSAEEIKKDIESGNTALGIEFGSTRIKAVLTDGTTAPIAQGSYEWENRLENGISRIPRRKSQPCFSNILRVK